jgi:hypothetical protein
MTSRASRKLSKAEIARALDDTREASKVAEKGVGWSDIKDGFKVVPKTDQNGVMEANVSLDQSTDEGRRNAGLMQEMYRPYYRAESERASEIRGRQPMVTIRDERGRERKVQQRFAEHLERKLIAKRPSHERRTFTRPRMPWEEEDEAPQTPSLYLGDRE